MAKTAARKTPVKNIQDVPHETVSPTNGHEIIKAEIMTEEQVITAEVQKFKVSDQRIAELEEQYGKLEITGPDDKAGYEAVKSAWNEVRSTRTGLEKTGVDLRRRFTAITKGIIKEEDRLVLALTPLEKKLYDRWKKIDDDKEAVKQAKEKAEQEKLLERIRELTEAGIAQVDGFYTIGGTIAVDVTTLRGLDEKRYNQLLGAVKDKKTEIDEAARLELEKIEKQRAELAQAEADLKRLREEAEAQTKQFERLKDEAVKLHRQNNAAKLMAMGMRDDYEGAFVYSVPYMPPVVVKMDRLDLPADEFKLLQSDTFVKIQELNKAAEDEKFRLEKEAAELAARKDSIAIDMQAIGFKYNYQSKAFEFANEFHRAGYSMTVLLEMDAEQFESMRLSELAHIENATQKQEEARQAAQSDETNFFEYLDKLHNVPYADFKTERIIKDFDGLLLTIQTLRKKYEQK